MGKHYLYFISPHGFGHAARSAAVIQSILEEDPANRVEIFSGVPEWFFRESIKGHFDYQLLKTDVGLVQKDSMTEDLDATLTALGIFFNQMPLECSAIKEKFAGTHIDGVICDISPLGIELARLMKVPSILIENFTWDWIYANYTNTHPGFLPYIERMAGIYGHCDYHIRCQPAGELLSRVNLTCGPISRKPRLSKQQIRKELQINEGQTAVLITLGGIPTRFRFLETLTRMEEIVFIVPGSSDEIIYKQNLRLLPHHSRFYHPDLMASCDALIGKAGYSTISEAYWAGVPFGYLLRPSFRESGPLAVFIQDSLNGIEFFENDFENRQWQKKVADLLKRPRQSRDGVNGSEQVNRFLMDL